MADQDPKRNLRKCGDCDAMVSRVWTWCWYCFHTRFGHPDRIPPSCNCRELAASAGQRWAKTLDLPDPAETTTGTNNETHKHNIEIAEAMTAAVWAAYLGLGLSDFEKLLMALEETP